MEREEALAALQQDQRSRDAVRAGSRWTVRILLYWGIVTLVVEPATVLAGFPWLFVPLAVFAIFVIWLGIYANRQRVTTRGFGWRYVLIVVLTMAVLHPAYLGFMLVTDQRNPFVAILLGSVVAIPLFVGAYVESRQK
jgi:hypothetical protein